MISRRQIILGAASLPLAACAVAPENRPLAQDADILKLTDAIFSMGPNVSGEEALRAAKISFDHTRELAIRYQITDPPLLHNTKVNMGLRPRGLCWHWAEDLEKRLNAEGFETLQMHRAIAEGQGLRIDHSTAIISQRGDPFDKGVVLDPWRTGGTLFYAPVVEDTRYQWEERGLVLRRRADLRSLAN